MVLLFLKRVIWKLSECLYTYDLAVILDNLLGNAIDACLTVPSEAEGRFIRLYSYEKGSLFFIEAENCFSGKLTIDEYTGLPQSSKAESAMHGMGLSNIRRCARKYLGDMEYQISEAGTYRLFRLIVMLKGDSLSV